MAIIIVNLTPGAGVAAPRKGFNVKGEYFSYVKVGPNWVPLTTYRLMKAEAAREIVGAIVFIGIICFVMGALLWGLP